MVFSSRSGSVISAMAVADADADAGKNKDVTCKKCQRTLAMTQRRSCARCRKTYYCGRPCQLADWKTGTHKSECLKIRALENEELDAILEYAATLPGAAITTQALYRKVLESTTATEANVERASHWLGCLSFVAQDFPKAIEYLENAGLAGLVNLAGAHRMLASDGTDMDHYRAALRHYSVAVDTQQPGALECLLSMTRNTDEEEALEVISFLPVGSGSGSGSTKQ